MIPSNIFSVSLSLPSSLDPVTRTLSHLSVVAGAAEPLLTFVLWAHCVDLLLCSVFKSRGVTLPTNVRLVKAVVFPVVMYGCESWTVKKAERRRIDAFELWCWRRLLRVPWTAKEIQPVHSEGDLSWMFTGRTDVEAETPVLWPPHAKS